MNKDDFHRMEFKLSNMNDRMRHLAIMLNELATSFKPIRDSVNCFDDGRK